MLKSDLQPQNLPEKITWYYITGTYIAYLLGAQFFCAILFALFLMGYALWTWLNPSHLDENAQVISPSAIIWLGGMVLIWLALLIGHLDFGYGIVNVAKSSLKWIPFTLFPLAGYWVKIRAKLIYRAVCILCFQSLCLIPILTLTIFLKIPNQLYTSPLAVLGGESTRYAVKLYTADMQEARLPLFAPHCPALGLVGGVYFCLALQESNPRWRRLGIIGSLGMVIASVSRAAILSIPIVLLLMLAVRYVVRPWFHFLLAVLGVIGGMFLPTALIWIEDFQAQLYSFRAGSSKTRAILEQMALDQWHEAPWWGHGMIDSTGPSITGEMAIGTHHTWFGMLYTQGLIGMVALAIALGWSFLHLLLPLKRDQSVRYAALGTLCMLLLFTFADIVYDYSYIYWPGLLMIGQSFRSPNSSAQTITIT